MAVSAFRAVISEVAALLRNENALSFGCKNEKFKHSQQTYRVICHLQSFVVELISVNCFVTARQNFQKVGRVQWLSAFLSICEIRFR